MSVLRDAVLTLCIGAVGVGLILGVNYGGPDVSKPTDVVLPPIALPQLKPPVEAKPTVAEVKPVPKERPDFEAARQIIEQHLQNNGLLAPVLAVTSVQFIDSEQKFIEGQPHYFADYKVNIVARVPVLWFSAARDAGWVIDGSGSSFVCLRPAAAGEHPFSGCNHAGAPIMLPVRAVWKRTDAGWREVLVQRVYRGGP